MRFNPSHKNHPSLSLVKSLLARKGKRYETSEVRGGVETATTVTYRSITSGEFATLCKLSDLGYSEIEGVEIQYRIEYPEPGGKHQITVQMPYSRQARIEFKRTKFLAGI